MHPEDGRPDVEPHNWHQDECWRLNRYIHATMYLHNMIAKDRCPASVTRIASSMMAYAMLSFHINYADAGPQVLRIGMDLQPDYRTSHHQQQKKLWSAPTSHHRHGLAIITCRLQQCL